MMIDKIKEKLIADRNYFNPANNDFQNGRNYEAQRILDFIDELEQKLNLSGIGRPASESAREGEPLPVEGVAQSGRVRCSCMNQEVGQEWCDKFCVDAGEYD